MSSWFRLYAIGFPDQLAVGRPAAVAGLHRPEPFIRVPRVLPPVKAFLENEVGLGAVAGEGPGEGTVFCRKLKGDVLFPFGADDLECDLTCGPRTNGVG